MNGCELDWVCARGSGWGVEGGGCVNGSELDWVGVVGLSD